MVEIDTQRKLRQGLRKVLDGKYKIDYRFCIKFRIRGFVSNTFIEFTKVELITQKNSIKYEILIRIQSDLFFIL